MWLVSKRVSAVFLFNLLQEIRFASRNSTMLCTKNKFVRWTITATTTPQAQVSKLRKSHNQYSAWLPVALFIAAHPCLIERTNAELLWVSCVFLAVTTTGISLSRKCDFTTCRSRPWVHTRTFGFCLIICDVIGIKLFAEPTYCPGRCSQLSGHLNFASNGLQRANGTLT